MGRVYDTAGNFYSDWPDKLAAYIPGNSYEITYEENEFRGKMYAKVKERKPLGGSQAAAVKAASPAMGTHDEGEDMMVRGLMCSAYQGVGGLPDYATLCDEMAKIRHAWRDAKKSDPIPDVKEELNDEIPF